MDSQDFFQIKSINRMESHEKFKKSSFLSKLFLFLIDWLKKKCHKQSLVREKEFMMFARVDAANSKNDQGGRAQRLFAAVVLAALDDAIADDKKYGNGAEQIARWARSRDGREVLMCAGIDPNERCVKGMVGFVKKGVRTSVALSREESERQAEAA